MFQIPLQKYALLAFFTLVMAACSGGSSSTGAGLDDTGNGLSRGSLSVCESPRTRACTRDYRPVCGLDDEGTLETFANSCTACASENVEGFFPGACVLSQMNACTDPRPDMCTADYQPACGVSADGELKTYANACNACSNSGTIGVTSGQCPMP